MFYLPSIRQEKSSNNYYSHYLKMKFEIIKYIHSGSLIHGSKYFQISTFYVMVVYKYLASDVALLITNLV